MEPKISKSRKGYCDGKYGCFPPPPQFHLFLRPLWIHCKYEFKPKIQGVSKRALQRYSKCYCVASVTKTFTLEGLQTIHLSTPILTAVQIISFVPKFAVVFPKSVASSADL
jgi:hypothetical protein